MKSILYSIFIFFFLNLTYAIGQEQEGFWDSYITNFENGLPGAITLRMDSSNIESKSEFPYLLSVRLHYTTTRADGFPTKDVQDRMYRVESEILTYLEDRMDTKMVGVLMHDSKRELFLYLKDYSTLKYDLEEFVKSKYPNRTFTIDIQEDRNWKCYREFLYPNSEIANYMANETALRDLQLAGDKLVKERRIDHWIRFKNQSDKDKCLRELQSESFQEVTQNSNSTSEYELQVWRKDFIDIDFIHPVTENLRAIAIKYNGVYDGWQSDLIIE